MHKARVYFYLGSPGEMAEDTPAAPGPPVAAQDSAIGISESEIMSFIHDAHHRCEVVLTPEPTDESVRAVLQAKHPRQIVRLKTVIWL